MMPSQIGDFNCSTRIQKPQIGRFRTNNGKSPDVTLINMNLMLVNQNGKYDQQNYVPLGILYIASFLKKHGYNVEIIDYQLFSHAKEFNAKLFVETISETSPIVGFSTMTNLLPFTILCAIELKRKQPRTRIVLGGVGPSPVGKEIIAAFPFIDSVIEGEGELAMLNILRGGKSYSTRRILDDLDEIPIPPYSLMPLSQYNSASSIITSRGCPYQCTFCTEPHNFGGNVRYRSIKSVIDEISILHNLTGNTLFLFQDDILPLERARFRKLMNELRNLPFEIRWKCFCRVDLIDEELMIEMAKSGCVQIRYGIESGSNRTLRRINKGFKIEKAYEIVKKSVEHFPSVHTSFIWGYPFERLSDFEETLKWVSKFEKTGASVLLFEFSPLPGSLIYKEYSKNLKFSRHYYPFFVITGHEIVNPGNYEVKPELNSIYTLIEQNPNIFPGFYHYDNLIAFKKREKMKYYQTTRRTPIKSQYDY